ncbi:MalY/PatB family protein [Flavonifractor hominis]|uniref:cysteine-S-conjugate beta-lyase n=1 Tax=Flavonifractor hominis TaxID=3133178 RepID=A0ABV1EQK9_9FIRM
MNYDFDHLPDRHGTFSYKWDEVASEFPQAPDVIPMWVADTDFPCPKEIVEAIQKRAAHPIYGYGQIDHDSAALLAQWEKKRNQWDVDPQWITYCNGVVVGLNAIISAFSEEGDGVIIQPPVYYPFREAVEKTRRKLCLNELYNNGDHWAIDFEQLERLAKDPCNKILLLCNPHNPVSRVYRRDELEKIGEICLKHHVVIASDEIHSDLIYPGHKHIPIASLSPEIAAITVTAVSPSKTFNIAGLQMSALIAPSRDMLERLEEELDRRCYIPNLFGSIAWKAAYSDGGCEEYVEELMNYLWGNYLYLDQYLREHMPKIRCQKPEATYLMWLDCSGLGLEQEELKRFFVEDARVGVEEGTLFGGASASFMRMNIGCARATLKQALEQLESAYQKRGF